MNETTTMMHVICGCTHAAYYHNPGKGCDFCDCLYDPRQILLERIDALEAVAEAARAVVFEYWESPESTPSKANIAMKDLVDKVAALKGAE